MIPLGDIDLQYDTGVIGRQREWGRPRVRRVYSAKVEGRNSNVTVAMYQGHGAEEVCPTVFCFLALLVNKFCRSGSEILRDI
jgi:hypothetical protein